MRHCNHIDCPITRRGINSPSHRQSPFQWTQETPIKSILVLFKRTSAMSQGFKPLAYDGRVMQKSAKLKSDRSLSPIPPLQVLAVASSSCFGAAPTPIRISEESDAILNPPKRFKILVRNRKLGLANHKRSSEYIVS